METVYRSSRGPRVKRGSSKIRMGGYAAEEYEGSALLQILSIVIVLGLLSVVAIPRYIETKHERQRAAEAAEARGFIRSLHSVLTANTADHYLRGTAWVQNGEELMALLGNGRAMPKGMKYADNVWTDEKLGLQWAFDKASGLLPPRVKRIEHRPPPESWDMEPIGRIPRKSPPHS